MWGFIAEQSILLLLSSPESTREMFQHSEIDGINSSNYANLGLKICSYHIERSPPFLVQLNCFEELKIYAKKSTRVKEATYTIYRICIIQVALSLP